MADKAFIQAHYMDVQPNSADYEKILIEELEDVIRLGAVRGRLIPLKQQRGVVATFGPEITTAISEFMQGSKNKALRSAAMKFAFANLFHGLFSPVSSGFVIAGFGDNDVFPALIAHETDAHAPFHAVDECVLKESRKSRRRDCASYDVLQFRPYPSNASRHSRDGRWRFG